MEETTETTYLGFHNDSMLTFATYPDGRPFHIHKDKVFGTSVLTGKVGQRVLLKRHGFNNYTVNTL